MIPLWADNGLRRFVAASVTVALLAGGGYLIYEYRTERQQEARDREAVAREEREKQEQVAKMETSIMRAFCEKPMNFDEMYQHHLDYGQNDYALVDQAMGVLTNSGWVTRSDLTIESPKLPDKQVTLRLFRVGKSIDCSALPRQ